MNYSLFKSLAEDFVKENYGSLEVLYSYNQSVQNKVHSHLLTIMLADCNSNGEEIKKVMNECKRFENKFFNEYRK